jgi:hypothetical protein
MMIEATMTWEMQDNVFALVGKYATDWEEEYADCEEVTICFYFEEYEDLFKAERAIRLLDRYGVRWSSK